MHHTRLRPKVCDRARTYASLRLDGELSEFESALLSSHLETCSACRTFDAEVGELTAELRAAPLARMERQVVLPTRLRAGLRRVQLGAAAAVLVTVVGAGGLLSQLSLGESPTFDTLRNPQPVEPSLRALRADDLRPDAPRPQGVKILPA